VALSRLVNGVGKDLEYGVLTALETVRAEDDRRSGADTFCAFQGGYAFVTIGFFFLHGFSLSSIVYTA